MRAWWLGTTHWPPPAPSSSSSLGLAVACPCVLWCLHGVACRLRVGSARGMGEAAATEPTSQVCCDASTVRALGPC